MKKVVILLVFIFSFAGFFIACDGGGSGGCGNTEPEVDPCTETPNCIPDWSDWKLHYTPYNADCVKCHTTCTPSEGHTFCVTGQSWNVAYSNCLKCHSTQHQQ